MSNTVHLVPIIVMDETQMPMFEVPEDVKARTFDNESDHQEYTKSVVEIYQKQVDHALMLKQHIVEAVEKHGACALSFTCRNRTLHGQLAEEWGKALPQYSCYIDTSNRTCLLEKRVNQPYFQTK